MINKCPKDYGLNYTTKNCAGTVSECYKCYLNALRSDKYFCKDCGIEINSGEYKTFGVCDNCFDKS